MHVNYVEVPIKDKVYRVKQYPPSDDPTGEALRLIANARETFFDIAEDGISVPPHLLDEKTGQLISDKRTIAEVTIASREELYRKALGEEALYKKPGHAKLAGAKLAGAYVNMIELVADAMLANRSAGKEEEYNENRHKMTEYYKKVQELIPCINLKGRKGDIDKVLLALLGEVPKAAVFSPALPLLEHTEIVHNYESANAARAMHQVDLLTGWMHDLAKQTPAFAACTPSIAQLGDAVKERLGLRREDLAACDASELRIRQISRGFRETIAGVAKLDKKLHPVANDMIRGSDVINEMIKQGPKPVSVSLVMGIRQIEEMAEMLNKMLSALPTETTKAPRKALGTLLESERTHMLNMLRHGIPRPYFATDFYNSFTAAANAPFEVPSPLAHEAEPIIRAYQKGVEVMGRIPPDLRQANEDIIHAREAATAELNDYKAQYGALAPQKGKC